MKNYREYKQQVLDYSQELVTKVIFLEREEIYPFASEVKRPWQLPRPILIIWKCRSTIFASSIFRLIRSRERINRSIESGMHAAVYEARADVGCVIHTHQVYASALALIDAPIPALYDEQVRWLGRSVEIVPYAPSGTGFLKKNISKMVKNNHNAYILKNHGAMSLGPNPERAVHNMMLLEKCALTYILALCTEKEVHKIPLAIREIVFAKLRKDQKKLGAA